MRGLIKALYIVINDFHGKLYLSFFIVDIPLLTLEIAPTICCLKLSFSSSIKPRCFDKALLQLEYCSGL